MKRQIGTIAVLSFRRLRRIFRPAPPGYLHLINRPAGGSLFGLIAFSVEVARKTQARTVEIAIGGHQRSFEFPAMLDSTGRHAFHINSHVLADGRYRLTAAVDGKRLAPFDLDIDNSGGLAEKVRHDLAKIGLPPILGPVIDAGMFPYAAGDAGAGFDDVPADIALSLEPAADAAAAHAHLKRWGFCLLPDQVPPELIARFSAEIDTAIADGTIPYRPGSSERIYLAHRLPTGQEIWFFPPLMKFLSDYFKDTACACQTLLYMNGSEQDPHQDTIHLTPYPAGYMCGAGLALEDIQPDSGELVVYPGSHRTARLYAGTLGLGKVSTDYSSYRAFDQRIRELLGAGGYEPVVYRPKAGQILIWHENLIHGGSPRRDRALTRKSIVGHYFPRGGIAFYDSRGEAAFLEPA